MHRYLSVGKITDMDSYCLGCLFCTCLSMHMIVLTSQTHDETPSFNIKAKESSKEEEVLAICKLRGVDASAPVSLQLKALDEEYHHLLDTGQSSKADQLQNLFVWYSKKASQVGFFF